MRVIGWLVKCELKEGFSLWTGTRECDMLKSHWLDCRTRTCFGEQEPPSSRLRQKMHVCPFFVCAIQEVWRFLEGGVVVNVSAIPCYLHRLYRR